MPRGHSSAFERRRVPDERLPSIELMPVLAHRTPMHGLLEVDVTLPRELLRRHRETTGQAWSFTAFLIACLARAIAENPQVQGLRAGRRIVVFREIDVAALVEAGTGQGRAPVVHIVRDTASRPVADIHDEIRAAQRDRSLVPGLRRRVRLLRSVPRPVRLLMWRVLARSPQLRKRLGGTAAVTSIGMFAGGPAWGITPAAHPVHLTVGGIGTRTDLIEGQPVGREVLCITLTLDHDVVDGAPAARFGARLRELIEQAHGLDRDPPETHRPAG